MDLSGQYGHGPLNLAHNFFEKIKKDSTNILSKYFQFQRLLVSYHFPEQIITLQLPLSHFITDLNYVDALLPAARQATESCGHIVRKHLAASTTTPACRHGKQSVQ